jgi:hypothetical protein
VKTEGNYYTEGDFFFEGDAILSGSIEVDYSVGAGFHVSLAPQGKRASYSQYASALRVVSFLADANTTESFRAEITTKNPKALCWRTTVKLRIKKFTVREGPGSDETGTWPTEFQVLSVGKWRKCEAS